MKLVLTCRPLMRFTSISHIVHSFVYKKKKEGKKKEKLTHRAHMGSVWWIEKWKNTFSSIQVYTYAPKHVLYFYSFCIARERESFLFAPSKLTGLSNRQVSEQCSDRRGRLKYFVVTVRTHYYFIQYNDNNNKKNIKCGEKKEYTEGEVQK